MNHISQTGGISAVRHGHTFNEPRQILLHRVDAAASMAPLRIEHGSLHTLYLAYSPLWYVVFDICVYVWYVLICYIRLFDKNNVNVLLRLLCFTADVCVHRELVCALMMEPSHDAGQQVCFFIFFLHLFVWFCLLLMNILLGRCWRRRITERYWWSRC